MIFQVGSGFFVITVIPHSGFMGIVLTTRRKQMPYKTDYDKLFCLYGKKYNLSKLLLKAVAICESSLDEKAYRFEPAFFRRYLANHPDWKDKDPAEVSASWGLFQLMWTTAHSLGFRGTSEELCNPVYNIELGTKLLRKNINLVHKKNYQSKHSDQEISLAKYNGGNYKNPDSGGNIRNIKYVKKVMRTWADLKKQEKECADD